MRWRECIGWGSIAIKILLDFKGFRDIREASWRYKGLLEGSRRLRRVVWQLSVGPLGRKRLRMGGEVGQPLMAE